VVPGRGNASRDLTVCAAELVGITGMQLRAGSLNLLLAWPLRLDERTGRPFDGGERIIWEANLDGLPVWAYRWRHAPLHALEILAAVDLRRALSLDDGDTVSLTMSAEAVLPLGMRDRAAWMLAWLGRRDWCYTSDKYYYYTAPWCRRHGATQDSLRCAS
jgi:hypothetical protein